MEMLGKSPDFCPIIEFLILMKRKTIRFEGTIAELKSQMEIEYIVDNN